MRKILRITLGFVILGVGLVLAIPGVPGPGIVVIILGLVILAEHFHWARRMLQWAKSKTQSLRKKAGLGGASEPPASS